jgi:hypothetical protein
MPLSSRQLLGAAAILLVACSNETSQLTVLKPEITVAPSTVDFGEVYINELSQREMTIANSGRATLDVASLSFTGTGAECFSVDVDAFSLEVDDFQPLRVAFNPTSPVALDAELVIESNALDAETTIVPIVGDGLDSPACELSLSTTSLDFGDVPADSGSEIDFVELTNVGRGPCSLDNITLTGSGAFTIIAPADFGGGIGISPQSGDSLVVEYSPSADDGDSATIAFASNDPALATGEIELSGNGGAEVVYPEAVIDCPTGIAPPTTITLDGSASVDPVGDGLTYSWFLVEAPDGSNGLLSNADQVESELVVDVAGDWEVQLQVTDSTGLRSAPATCHFEAVPENLLHVELVWDTADADMDLHLAQSGFNLFEGIEDVSYCNPNPDWGDSGVASDDPVLELDSESYGPENIVIPDPASGNYDVRVHYFSDRGANRSMATVRIWLNGRLFDEHSAELNHNQVWDVGYIRWPDAVFVPDEAPIYEADVRSCD